MSKEYIHPAELYNSRQYGFSQVVATQGGRTIYLSGQVAWDADGNIVGGDDFAAQLEQTFANIEHALQAAGGQLSDVVSLRIYTIEEGPQELRQIRAALQQHFEDGRGPATTWLGVRALSNPDFLIEIEAFAVIDD